MADLSGVFLLYALIIPRFKDYSYILLIAPAFYVVMASRAFTDPFASFFLWFARDIYLRTVYFLWQSF